MTKLLESDHNICVYELVDGDIRLLITNFGASIYSVEVKNAAGEYQLVTLTADSIPEFVDNGAFFGATVGRTVNRINKGRFTMNGKQYQLTINDGENSAHGGDACFATRAWDSEILADGSVAFHLESADGEGGYPGNLSVTVTYTLKDNKIHISHRAKSDADTIVNFTNHTYWCLSGHGEKIYNQDLFINGTEYLETRDDLIPTGQVLSVKGTPFDFTEPTKLGAHIADDHPSLAVNRGYDVSFVRKDRDAGLAARLFDPESGRTLTVYSSYPDIHIYTGNFLDGTKGARGIRYEKHDAICLEGSLFPDAINHPCFGKIVLKKGEQYDEFIDFQFSV